MRRLDSTTRSPLYNLYGETLGGIAVIRAFGAASKTLSTMMKAIDTNVVTSYWMVSPAIIPCMFWYPTHSGSVNLSLRSIAGCLRD